MKENKEYMDNEHNGRYIGIYLNYYKLISIIFFLRKFKSEYSGTRRKF